MPPVSGGVAHRVTHSASGHLPSPAETVQPAGEAFKNVQLLKDAPAGEFIKAMQQISASPREQCSFCHVRGDFASDEKQEKKPARTMVMMVRNINEQFFAGRNTVQCYTCHRGAARPFRHHRLLRAETRRPRTGWRRADRAEACSARNSAAAVVASSVVDIRLAALQTRLTEYVLKDHVSAMNTFQDRTGYYWRTGGLKTRAE
jgi:hypothetical protein